MGYTNLIYSIPMKTFFIILILTGLALTQAPAKSAVAAKKPVVPVKKAPVVVKKAPVVVKKAPVKKPVGKVTKVTKVTKKPVVTKSTITKTIVSSLPKTTVSVHTETVMTSQIMQVEHVIMINLPVITTQITFEEVRLSRVHSIMRKCAKKIHFFKLHHHAKKLMKFMKKLKACKRNNVDARKKIAVAKAQKKVMVKAKLMTHRAKKVVRKVKHAV